jgi:cell surface protein SprA
MRKKGQVSLAILGLVLLALQGRAMFPEMPNPWLPKVSLDTIPYTDQFGQFDNTGPKNPFDLRDPKNIKTEVSFDPSSGQYILSKRLGNEYYGAPIHMNFEEFMKWKSREQDRNYFDRLAGLSGNEREGGVPDPLEKYEVGKTIVDRLFGGSEIDVKLQGNVDLKLGGTYQNIQNPLLLERTRRRFFFDFDMGINMNLNGSVGEKMQISSNFNTQSTFNFDQQINIDYIAGDKNEDEIIKNIEAGNVSLPLPSNLIQGAQSLFGIKTELQFGRLYLTALASQQRSQQKNIQVQGGSQLQEYELRADDYDENRHFFLSHFNRATFEEALENMPQILSFFKLQNLEIWVTADQNQTTNDQFVDIVALADLGEHNVLTNNTPNFGTPGPIREPDRTGQFQLPTNNANGLMEAVNRIPDARNIDRVVSVLSGAPFFLEAGKDFEKVRARRLQPSEYTFNEDLGYISLNISLRPNQVLAVSYEYAYNKEIGFRVGELANENPTTTGDTLKVLYTKLLKGINQRVDQPSWDLMMKNFYSTGAFQAAREDFRFDIFYQDPGGGEKRFLPTSNLAGKPLLNVFNMDNLNAMGDPMPDGQFDYVPGLTINPQTGRIMFPKLEPFGSSLAVQLEEEAFREQYVYQQLYDSTLVLAREFPDLNRFVMRGSYKSSISSEISLGAFNVPRGSVRVSAGAQNLVEGVDYEIDYNLGRVRILNDALLTSGVPVNVSFEDQALFSNLNKTMLGLRAEYRFSEKLNLGATYMQLFERPFTQKVNIGEDPINNRVFGFDMRYSDEAPWITRMVDKIPFIDTKEPSNINVELEAAFLKPGHSRAINLADDTGGSVYLDDFEGSTTRIDLRTPFNQWYISSIPQFGNQPALFPESVLNNSLLTGVNRGLINWFRFEDNARTQLDQGDNYASTIPQNEIFRGRFFANSLVNFVQPFDVVFYPYERGPYNFDVPGGTQYSAGLSPDGKLNEPRSRWGGIMRSITSTNFEQANIEYVEFWVMSPFMDRPNATTLNRPGFLYLDLGSISEDVLKDSRMFFENGMPTEGSIVQIDTTNLGVIPRTRNIVRAFDAIPENRTLQDVGYEGLDDEGERQFFGDYLQLLQGVLTPEAYAEIEADPAGDNFVFYRDPVFQGRQDITAFDKYKRFNHPQGNSGLSAGNDINSSTQLPDSEDINGDNTLNETEAYFQYKIPLVPDGRGGINFEDNPYITDTIVGGNGRLWYRFKVPLNQPTNRIGNIRDFRAIQFIRLWLHDFESEVILRFATLDLVRNQWRRYSRDNRIGGVSIPGPSDDNVVFDLNAVSIEENSQKVPFNYVIPPGIQRERIIGSFQTAFQNEQSLSFDICNLSEGRFAAAWKVINFDMRLYDSLKMFVHAESRENLKPGDVSIFMRIGSDFINNYYEYEIPLTMSQLENVVPGREAEEIWLRSNAFNFGLKLLRDIKLKRNAEGHPINVLYESQDPQFPDNIIRVIGNPNLGDVESMMVGVKNPVNNSGTHCLEVWINELRVTGLDDRGGLAAIGRVDMKLADLGTLAFTGNYSTVGWGGLDQKVQARQREEIIQYGVATNIALDKFLPENTGIRLPFAAQYSQSISNPQFDPYDRDLEFKDKLRSAESREERDSLRRQGITFGRIRDFNFTNVRKDRTTDRIPLPFDISNFAFTYAFTDQFRTDPIIEEDRLINQRGGLIYNYTIKPLYIEPFKALIKNDKFLKFIKDINFNPIPNSINFSTNLDRYNSMRRFRFNDDIFGEAYDKRFTWDRTYAVNWDIMKSLRLRFDAFNLAVIDELPTIDFEQGVYTDPQEARDFLVRNFRNLGRNKNYNHNINLTFDVPIKKLPFMDWVDVKAQATASYDWTAGALNVVDELGNVIQNTQARQLTGDFNFDRLYSKSEYLKEIDKGFRGGAAPAQTRQPPARRDPNAGQASTKEDEKEKKEKKGPGTTEKIILRPLLTLRKFRFNYRENTASVVPGFMPVNRFMGLDDQWNGPGLDFIMGFAPNDAWFNRSIRPGNDWITSSIFLNQQVFMNYTQTFDARLTIEPFKDFRVDIDVSRNYQENVTEFFSVQNEGDPFSRQGRREVGSFTTSYMALNTIFGTDINELFRVFEDNRPIVSKRLGGTDLPHSTDEEYAFGFGRVQQDVLIPAFVAAYTGTDPNLVSLDLFSQLPRPNWNLSYNGLSKIPYLKEIFSSVVITHGYKSSLTVNNFQTNTIFLIDPDSINIATKSYYSRFQIPSIEIREDFSPVFGVDLRTTGGISLRSNFRKSRLLQLSFIDNVLNETVGSEFSMGFGYEIKNFRGGRTTGDRGRNQRGGPSRAAAEAGAEVNPITINFNMSIRDDNSVIHQLDQLTEATSLRGLRTVRINPTVDYQINSQMTLRFFYDYSNTVPYVTTSFPITVHNGGIVIRFTFN